MILTLEESEALQQALSLLSESTDLRFKAAQISLSAKFAPALPLSPQDI
jgi:hypothetical protein